MSFLSELTARVAALEAQLQLIEQMAKVVEVHEDTNLLDVEVRGVRINSVPYLATRAGTVGKTYWVPEVGEAGFLKCPGGEIGNAYFQTGLNYDTNPAPEMDANMAIRIFADEVKEIWNGNDDTYMLGIGGDAIRKTDRDPGKNRRRSRVRETHTHGWQRQT